MRSPGSIMRRFHIWAVGGIYLKDSTTGKPDPKGYNLDVWNKKKQHGTVGQDLLLSRSGIVILKSRRYYQSYKEQQGVIKWKVKLA